MSTTILTSTYAGPYWSNTRTTDNVSSISEFIFCIRSHFEERVDAILVLEDEKVTGLWLCEPGIDCDCDGFYEMSADYVGQDYVLYRPDDRGFWNSILYNFGIKYIPSDVGCTAKRFVNA